MAIQREHGVNQNGNRSKSPVLVSGHPSIILDLTMIINDFMEVSRNFAPLGMHQAR
jgi:hypothetical protein